MAVSAAGKERQRAGWWAWYYRQLAQGATCHHTMANGRACGQVLHAGRCLTHDTRTPAELAELCRQIAPLGACATPRGEKSPHWKGDQAKVQSGRQRARRAYAAQPCENCGAHPEQTLIHRHHRDGNTRNNARSNIEFLCVPCHVAAHGGRAVWYEHG